MKKLFFGISFLTLGFATLAPYAHAAVLHKPVRTIHRMRL